MVLLRVLGETRSGPFCAGLLYDDDDKRIVIAAPILKWAIGQKRSQFMIYARKRGWKIEVVE